MNIPAVGFEMGRTDRVTAVIIPMDGATRLPIRTGIHAELWDVAHRRPHPTRLVTNLGGQVVLLNVDADQELTFRILTARSPYRGPVFTTFNPKQDGIAHVVALERRTDASFDDITTLVLGVVTRADFVDSDRVLPVEGAIVSVHGVDRPQFSVTTDHRGAFALPVDLSRPAPDEAPEVNAEIHIERDGRVVRTVPVSLEHGRSHHFAAPISLNEEGAVGFTHQKNHQ